MRRGSRTCALALAVVALSGCSKEPDFDARYDAAQKKIARTAADIEAQVNATGAPTPLASDGE